MLNSAERKIRVFWNGRSRAVRIPREFDFEGDEVIIRKGRDGTLTLKPVGKKMTPQGLVEWLRTQVPWDEDFPDVNDSDMLPLDDIKF